MMIPYHAGSVPKAVDQFQGAVDFSEYQHEHWHGYTKGQKVPVRLNDGTEITLVAGQPITRAHHHDDKVRYLEICDKAKITPKFPQLCGRGHLVVKKGHALDAVNVDHPNYMKLIRDVAANPVEQESVDPTKINWDAAGAHLEKWLAKGGMEADQRPNPAVLELVKDKLDRREAPRPQSGGTSSIELPILQPQVASRKSAKPKRASRGGGGSVPVGAAAAPETYRRARTRLAERFARAFRERGLVPR